MTLAEIQRRLYCGAGKAMAVQGLMEAENAELTKENTQLRSDLERVRHSLNMHEDGYAESFRVVQKKHDSLAQRLSQTVHDLKNAHESIRYAESERDRMREELEKLSHEADGLEHPQDCVCCLAAHHLIKRITQAALKKEGK